jgi:hypothetical protein
LLWFGEGFGEIRLFPVQYSNKGGGASKEWGARLGITLVVIVMTLLEWPKLQHLQKEKAAFVTLTVIGYVIAVLLLFYPEMPGPTQMFDVIYRPFTKILEK